VVVSAIAVSARADRVVLMVLVVMVISCLMVGSY
jgi:hypothetical protein